MTRIFAVDAETDGLYGPVWAIGAVVLDDNLTTTSQFGAQIDSATVTDPWTRENVVPHVDLAKFDSREALLNTFWDFWLRFRDGAEAVADCGVPVEAGLFRACVELDPATRTFQGPYPLHELATGLRMVGLDPNLDRRAYLRRNDLVTHDPVDDAMMAGLIWREVDARAAGRRPPSMVGRWRARRNCPHPRAHERGQLIDLGRRKLLECGLCGRREVV